MEPIAGLIRRLGEAIAAEGATATDVAHSLDGQPHDQGAPLGVRVDDPASGVRSVSVTRRWDTDEPNAAEVLLDEPVALSDLAPHLGGSQPLPSSRPGARQVRLGEPGPNAGWSVLAEVDRNGSTAKLSVRRGA